MRNRDIVNELELRALSQFIVSEKMVVSKYSAAEVYGFNEYINTRIDINVPTGYNPSSIRDNFNIKQNKLDTWEKYINVFTIDGKQIKITSPERTIVEIIKDNYKNLTDVIVGMIKQFFTTYKYDDIKLLRAAKLMKIEGKVKMLRSMALYG